MLPQLDAQLACSLESDPTGFDRIRSAPVRVLQIGTGNFLRAFTAWMFQKLNETGVREGAVAIAPATPGSSTTAKLRASDGCYTVLSCGLVDGQLIETVDRITCVTQIVDPFADWPAMARLAAAPSLEVVVSNTTEAGIRYEAVPPPWQGGQVAATFPAIMTAVLFARFEAGQPGLIFLPCELIEANGTQLRDIILRHADDWGLPPVFSSWVRELCVFCNTLVDRVVPGHPGDIDAIEQRLGYRDPLLVCSSLDYSWVIETPVTVRESVANQLPFHRAGLNVTFTDDVTPYRTRKVRILNGAHTVMTPVGFLAGHDTVLACMQDPTVSRFVEETIEEEIIPTLDLPPEDLQSYADETFNRFRNPTIHHRLLSIALNSTSKWAVRVMPSLLAYVQRNDALPQRLALSLAALICFYRVTAENGHARGNRGSEPYEFTDSPEAIRALSTAWAEHGPGEALVRTVLGMTALWDRDLNAVPGLTAAVTRHVETITRNGMQAALAAVR
jgi:tagaturonate reductase